MLQLITVRLTDSRASNVKALHFETWPDLHCHMALILKCQAWIRCNSTRAFERSLARFATMLSFRHDTGFIQASGHGDEKRNSQHGLIAFLALYPLVPNVANRFSIPFLKMRRSFLNRYWKARKNREISLFDVNEKHEGDRRICQPPFPSNPGCGLSDCGFEGLSFWRWSNSGITHYSNQFNVFFRGCNGVLDKGNRGGRTVRYSSQNLEFSTTQLKLFDTKCTKFEMQGLGPAADKAFARLELRLSGPCWTQRNRSPGWWAG